MKQKVVVRFGTKSRKSRSKALTIAVGVQGVTSVTLKGQDELEVVGEMMDSVVLTTLLRKGLGFAELVSVEEKKKEEEKPAVVSPYYYTYGPPYYYTNWALP